MEPDRNEARYGITRTHGVMTLDVDRDGPVDQLKNFFRDSVTELKRVAYMHGVVLGNGVADPHGVTSGRWAERTGVVVAEAPTPDEVPLKGALRSGGEAKARTVAGVVVYVDGGHQHGKTWIEVGDEDPQERWVVAQHKGATYRLIGFPVANRRERRRWHRTKRVIEHPLNRKMG
jgi:hypothetical protein